MVLPIAADGPMDCTDWDELCDEDGFLARGRNRYPVTYVIYTDGTYYYAENGVTGNLDYGGPNSIVVNGTSFPLVCQAAIDATNATGGIIRLRAGTYPLGTTTLTLNYHGMHLEGEGSDLAGTRGTIITYNGTGVALDVYRAAIRLQKISIRNLGIVAQGNAKTAANAIGIRVLNAEDVQIWNVMVREFEAGTGVTFDCDNTSYVAGCVVFNSYLWGNKYGVYCDGDSAGHEINDTAVLHTIIIGPTGPIAGSQGVTFDEFTNACFVLGGDIETYETAFYIDGDDNGFIKTRTEDISGIYFDVNATAANTRMYAHRFYGAGTYVADAGTDTRLVDCNPYVTKNLGTAVILNGTNSIVVAHGLSTTPTCINVTGTHAEVESTYVSTVGAANFTVHKGGAGNVTANRDVYWKAEVFA